MEIVVKPSPSELEETSGGSEGRAILCKRKNLRRVMEMLIFVACVGGFGYQSTEYVTNFYTYPTVINMDVQRMDEFPTPALTFCSKYLYDFVKYCGMHPNNCAKPGNIESFCLENPHKCNGNETDAVAPKLLPTLERMGSWTEFSNISLTASQAFHSEGDMGFEGPFFNSLYMRSGYEACYRAGNGFGPSGLQKTPNVKSKALPWKRFWVLFKKNKNIFFLPEAEPNGVLYIHSPLLSFRTSMKPITLLTDIEYIININLEQVQLLPHPYESDCVDYEELWKKNNKTGPVSSEMCDYRCDELSDDDDDQYYEKSGDYYAYGQPDLCDVLSKNPTSNEPEFNKCQCKKKCKNDCLKLNYGFSVYESNDLRLEEISPILSAIRVDLVIEKENVRVLSFTPKYMDVEVFSYVGGFMGCWLGISLWSSTGILWEGISAFAAIVKQKRTILGIASKNLDNQP